MANSSEPTRVAELENVLPHNAPAHLRASQIESGGAAAAIPQIARQVQRTLYGCHIAADRCGLWRRDGLRQIDRRFVQNGHRIIEGHVQPAELKAA